MDEANAARIQQFAILVFGVDDDEALLVVVEMALDQRQRAFADRAEADHHDGPVDAGVHWPFGHRQCLQERWSYPRRSANGRDAGRKPPGVHDILPELCGGGGETRLRNRLAGRAQQAARAFERARHEFEGEQAVALERTGHAQGARSSPPRSRSGCNRARRRPGRPRDGRAGGLQQARDAPAPRRCPRLRQSAATATGPRSSAGWPVPHTIFHSRAVPMTRLPSVATKARPSAGDRPSRSRCELLRQRSSPKASSSSASRAAMSGGRSFRIEIIAVCSRPGARPSARCEGVACGDEGSRRPAPGDVRCDRSSAARSR